MANDGQGGRTRDRAVVVRTVADVDLRPTWCRPVGSGQPATLDVALDELRQAVRPDDRICPYCVSRIAVEFGPNSDAVKPANLGARLARAVGRGLVENGGLPTGADAPASVAGAVRRPASTTSSTAVVTVERVFEESSGGTSALAASSSVSAARRPAGAPELDCRPPAARPVEPRRRQREVVRYPPPRLAGAALRPDTRRSAATTPTRGAVLVVDPAPVGGDTPGLAATAAADVARRLGHPTDVIGLGSDDGLVAEVGGTAVELLILVVGPESATATDWWTSSWSLPARITAAYRSKGVDVLTVSVGASVAAVCTCLEEGASVVYDLSTLADRLSGPPGPPEGGPRSVAETVAAPRAARKFRALTGAERRILFYLTTGRSPQAIADDLAVSLATVRSHIRSVLRKLGVRSQLAAVALVAGGAAPAGLSSA